jgi:hypothetical protein
MSDLLCKLEHVKNELFHFNSVRFVWFANLAGWINMRNLLFCNVMMQHSFLITSKIDERLITLQIWESVVSSKPTWSLCVGTASWKNDCKYFQHWT